MAFWYVLHHALLTFPEEDCICIFPEQRLLARHCILELGIALCWSAHG